MISYQDCNKVYVDNDDNLTAYRTAEKNATTASQCTFASKSACSACLCEWNTFMSAELFSASAVSLHDDYLSRAASSHFTVSFKKKRYQIHTEIATKTERSSLQPNKIRVQLNMWSNDDNIIIFEEHHVTKIFFNPSFNSYCSVVQHLISQKNNILYFHLTTF